MDNKSKTVDQLFEEQIRSTLEDLDIAKFDAADSIRPTLEKLKVLQSQHLELQKLESQNELRKKELEVELQKVQLEMKKLEASTELKKQEIDNELKKIAIETQKLESDTAIRIREVELKEASDKKNQELEELRVNEQKRANTTQAVLGGVTAATGVAGILATLHCFKKSMQFEETGSYTNKTGQHVGSLFNLFRKR